MDEICQCTQQTHSEKSRVHPSCNSLPLERQRHTPNLGRHRTAASHLGGDHHETSSSSTSGQLWVFPLFGSALSMPLFFFGERIGNEVNQSNMTSTEGHEKGRTPHATSIPPMTRRRTRRTRCSGCGSNGVPSEGHLLSQEPVHQLPNKLHSFLAPPSARLNRHNHEPAARGRRQSG